MPPKPSATGKVPWEDLPSKEASVFRTMTKHYEDKHYKKALKSVDSLLKKYPHHAESMAMRSLILSNMSGRQNEALTFVKEAVRCNLKNAMCWHIMGVLYRTSKDFNEAMRCFCQASRIEPDNMNIARDLANLQIHERYLSGYFETRKFLFFSKPSVRSHWTGYAFAHHLCGNYDLACQLMRATLTHFRNIQATENSHKEDAWEINELDLYEAQLLEEAGRYSDAITKLKNIESAADNIGRLEALGRLLIYERQFEAAHETYLDLIKRRPSDQRYLLCAATTHPNFVESVKFPPNPKELRNNEYGINHNSNTSSSSANFWLYLSPYALGSPLLNGSISEGWLVHPLSVLYSDTCTRDVSLCPATRKLQYNCPDDAYFWRIRSLTEAEEVLLSRWCMENIFLPRKDNVNNTALQFLLKHVTSRQRFMFYLDRYLRPKILKGATSVTPTLQTVIVQNEEKAKMLEELLHTYITRLNDNNSLGPYLEPPSEIKLPLCSKCATNEQSSTSPGTLILSKMALASLHFLKKRNNEALILLNEILPHTSTLLEGHLLQADVLHKMGRLTEAAEAARTARDMDLADRFLNTRCIKHTLAVNDIQEASRLALYFARNNDENDLTEMQSMWYEIALGEAHLRCGNSEAAIKQFRLVIKHFGEIKADQYDFHWYCVRRSSFRSYLQFLRMQDRIEAQKFYRKAAKNIIPLLLIKYDAQSKIEEDHQKSKQNVSNATTVMPSINKPVKETDTSSSNETQRTLCPLLEALKIVQKLTNAAQLDPESYVLAYEVYRRKGSTLLMLQCIYRLWKLQNSYLFHPTLTPLILHFLLNVVLPQEGMSTTFKENTNVFDTTLTAQISNSLLMKTIFLNSKLDPALDPDQQQKFLNLVQHDDKNAIINFYTDAIKGDASKRSSAFHLLAALRMQAMNMPAFGMNEVLEAARNGMLFITPTLKQCYSLYNEAAQSFPNSETYKHILKFCAEMYPDASRFNQQHNMI